MNVKDVMTKQVRSCRAGDALSTAAQIMWDHDCGCVPVVNDKEEVIGMVTDRDLCMAAYTRNELLGSMTVGSVMSQQIHACAPEDSVEAAEQIMRQHQIRRLPVLGFEGQLLGILSINDLARAASEKKRDHSPGLTPASIEATLAAVCRPRNGKPSAGAVITTSA
jgi:CBS domain-containing protein